MRYEAYENKIRKIASVLAIIYRHLLLIILCIMAVVGMTVAVIALKGTIMSIDVPEEFLYGDEIDVKGNAFFSSLIFEYCEKNGEWTEEIPKMPGEYKVRAFAKNSSGDFKYSDEFEFCILPKALELKCKENVFTYGDRLTPDTSGLAPGDSFKNIDINVISYKKEEVIYGTDSSDSSNLEILEDAIAAVAFTFCDTDAVRIVNADGEDVTYAYELFANVKEVDVRKARQTLRVSPGHLTKVYDGTGLSNNGYYEILEGKLINGDTMRIDVGYYSLKYVAKVSVNIDEVTIYDSKGKDISFLYNIVTEEGSIEVTPRPLHIVTESAEFVYDGNDHIFQNYTLEGTLAPGEDLMIEEHTSVRYASEDGPYVNSMSFHISGSNGNLDTTRNYDVTIDYGTITVNKRPVTIITGSATKEYDGKPLTCAEAQLSEALPATHYVNISETPILEDIGSIQNTCNTAMTTIINNEGVDVTNCFIIEGYEYGTLTVKQGPIVYVKIYPTQKTYNGNKISVDLADVAVPIVSGSVKMDYSKIDVSMTDTGVFTLEMLDSMSELCTAEIDGIKYPVKFVMPDGNYYAFYTVLSVERKQITISAINKSFVYEQGEIFVSNEVSISKGSLVNGHSVEVMCDGTINCTEDIEDGYTVNNIIVYCQILDANGYDVSYNYRITLEDGTLSLIRFDD